MKNRDGFLRSLSCGVALAAAGLQIAYLRSDRSFPTFDDAWYLETSFRLLNAWRDGLAAFLRAYSESFRIKAPLISVLPLPFYGVFGRTQGAALGVNVLMTLVLSIYVHRLAKRLFTERAALLAVATFNTLPLLYGLSRRFLVEYALTTLVAGWVYHLLASDGLQRKAHNLMLGVLLGLGLLLKVLFPLYIAGPALICFIGWRKEGLWSRGRAETAAREVIAPGLAIALSWYAFNWIYVFGYAFQAGFGSIASHYGSSLFSAKALFGYFRTLLTDAVSPFYAASGLLLAVGWSRQRPGLSQAGRVLLAWIALPLAAMLLGVNKDIRFAAPILPAAALALAGELDHALARARWAPAALAAFFLLPLDLYCGQSFGFSLISGSRPLAYNGPPALREDWRQEELVAELADRSLVVVGVEHPALNANNLAFLAAMKGLPLRFASLGYAQDSAEKAVIRIKEKDADAVLMVEGIPGPQLPAFLNRSNAGVLALLNSGKLPFARTKTFELSPGIRATLYERRKN
ncbi:MAG: glycosyltransferase family 39 protein [Elusimicrobia bacterium]|nr:glycosyltransferase family 39 protein [Elusimicrobiota bacterium]